MIDQTVKKIVVLLVDKKTGVNWSMVFDVGVNKYLVRISDYIRAAKCNPVLQEMQDVGIIEVRSDDYGFAHGTVINRWL